MGEHVNDAGFKNFQANCAACTVAGLLGKTYSEVLLELGTSDAGCEKVETIFDHFYPDAIPHRQEQFETFHPSKKQALGISAFLHRRGYHVAKVGGFDFHCPGQLPDLTLAMQQCSEDTKFAVLIGQTFPGKTDWPLGGAHWIAAQKTSTAVAFVDYQVDFDKNGIGIANTSDTALQRLTGAADGTEFGAPSFGDAPARAFGAKVKKSDRGIALAFNPA